MLAALLTPVVTYEAKSSVQVKEKKLDERRKQEARLLPPTLMQSDVHKECY